MTIFSFSNLHGSYPSPSWTRLRCRLCRPWCERWPSQRSPSTRPSLCGASHRSPWWTGSFPARKPSWGRSKSPSEIKAEFTSYPISIIQRITVFTVASFFLSTLLFSSISYPTTLHLLYSDQPNIFHFVVIFSFSLLLNFTLSGHMCPIFFTLTPGSWLSNVRELSNSRSNGDIMLLLQPWKMAYKPLLCGQN